LTLVVLLVLAALWAVVLLPPMLRARMARSVSSDSIGEFNYKLGVLSRTNGTSSAPLPRRSRGIGRVPTFSSPQTALHAPALSPAARGAKRRADVLRVLIGTVVVTLALAYFSGASLLWGVQLIADVALLGFLGLWAYTRNLQMVQTRNVHYLPSRRAPELALRRTGSS
jgi:hypothetical protein